MRCSVSRTIIMNIEFVLARRTFKFEFVENSVLSIFECCETFTVSK